MQPVLIVVSDRPFVWKGFHSPVRDVRRWVGERDSDEERSSARNFTGDPTAPETYRWTEKFSELSAVVDLQDEVRAQGAIDALRSVRPGAAVLVISADDDVNAEEIEISRRLAWTDALRGDLEVELKQLEAKRRLAELRKFAEGDGDVPILVHPDPDPDAIASALAVRALIRRHPDHSPIITPGEMTRPENRRMCELLRTRATVVTMEEVSKLQRVIAVDFLPDFSELSDQPRLAVIDHHPHEKFPEMEFSDIRPDYGATATMMTEYLRLEDERRIAEPLATALLYGIKTDTDSLARGSIAADVHAYAFLQNRADLTLLRRLERPSYSAETARSYGSALSHLAIENDAAVAFMGRLTEDDAHVLADIADFCLALEEITWSAAAAIIEENLIVTVRHLGGAPGAGDVAKQLAARGGNGGGHDTMARAVLPLEGEWEKFTSEDVAATSKALLELLSAELEQLQGQSSINSPSSSGESPLIKA